MRVAILLFTLGASTALSAQVVIPVSGGGAALANAVASAPNWAVLVVANGSYDNFNVADKDLTIVAPQRATILGPVNTYGAPQAPRTLRLVGLDLLSSGPGFPGRLVVRDHLYMTDCSVESLSVGTGNPQQRSLVHLSGCLVSGPATCGHADVVAADCSFNGAWGQSSQGPVPQVAFAVTGTLRAERCTMTGVSWATGGFVALSVSGALTLANCTVNSGPLGFALSCPATTTLWATTVIGQSTPYTVRPLGSVEWGQKNWSVGGTSTVVCREIANHATAVVLTPHIAPWSSPFAAELLWIGATPDWLVWTVGVTDAQGAFASTLTIPNVLALRYADAWLTGLFFNPLPLRSSVPLGGTIL
jgi:hypothetical protein